ncbi:MAG: hypothetical protein JO360_15910 [Acidobacteria bacterium]|nr:hypothetical protein [Acidobacteriota bacterium]
MKIAHRMLLALICLFAFGCAGLSLVFIMGSSYFVADIDYTEAQRQAAETRSWFIVAFGWLSLCVSMLLMFAGDSIARFVLKLFGAGELE